MSIAFLFPGQGAQSSGMGRALYESSPAARAAFETVDAACGFSVSRLCFEGTEEELRDTRNTQPALFAASVAALEASREAGLHPQAVAGHSIGEYAALVAAGALSIQEGARLVKARGGAMADAASRRPGAMAAVLGLDFDTVAATCIEVNNVGVVVPANINAPGQIVIRGETSAVEAASSLLKQRGAKRVLPLAVSGAFHSPLMELAAAVMTGVLALTDVTDPKIPIVANVTADYERTADEVRVNLAHQVAGPVRWVETIQRLSADGYTTFVECGPGSVISGLVKRIVPDARIMGIGDAQLLAAAKEALVS